MALAVIREGESKSEEALELMRFLFLPLPPLPATRIEEIMYV
jgi:hypothetical protein